MLTFYRNGKWADFRELEKKAEHRAVVLFGESKKNKLFFEEFPSVSVKYIFDNNEKKWETESHHIPVVQPFPKSEDVLLVSGVQDWFSISEQAKELGYSQLYFFMEEDELKLSYGSYLDAFYPFTWNHEKLEPDRIRYIHVIPDQKFFLPVMEMIEYAFDMREHFFYIYSINEANPGNLYHTWGQYKRLAKQYGNIYIQHEFCGAGRTDDETGILERMIRRAEKIIFHGEWLNRNVRGFFIKHLEEVRRKGVYIPWSGQAGVYPVINPNMEKLLQYARVITMELKQNISRNFVNARNAIWLNKYISYARRTAVIEPKTRKSKNIFIAHSAYDYSRAVETLEDLKILKTLGDDAAIYCIASYGEKEYTQRLIEKGKQYFGSKFHAVKDYLEYNEYVELLSIMDVAIIGMEVMAGRHTLELLCWSRVKVYLKPGTDVYQQMQSMGYRINDYGRIFEETEEELFFNGDEEWNWSIAAEEFDYDRKVGQWRELFEYPL